MVYQFATRNRETIIVIFERIDPHTQYIKEQEAVTRQGCIEGSQSGGVSAPSGESPQSRVGEQLILTTG